MEGTRPLFIVSCLSAGWWGISFTTDLIWLLVLQSAVEKTTNLRRPIPIVYKASVKLVPHSQLLEQLTTTAVQCFKVSTWSHQLQCDNQAASFKVLDQSVHLDPLMSHYRKSRRWELEQRETGMQKQFSSCWAKQQLTKGMYFLWWSS